MKKLHRHIKSLQLTSFDSLDQDKYQSSMVGMESGKTDKLRKARLKMTPCYAKSHWVQIFVNREKETIYLKTQITGKVSILQLEMLVISASFGDAEYRQCPTPEDTHLRISFSTILTNCLYHQGGNKSKLKGCKQTLSLRQRSKVITAKKKEQLTSK